MTKNFKLLCLPVLLSCLIFFTACGDDDKGSPGGQEEHDETYIVMKLKATTSATSEKKITVKGDYFKIDWGDGTDQRFEAANQAKTIPHTYMELKEYTVVLLGLGISEIEIPNNVVTELTITRAPKLLHLTCSNNEIKTLDITKASALTNLTCIHNQIEQLKAKGHQAIKSIIAEYNNLSSLDVSGCKNLINLQVASGNPLETLNASECTSIDKLVLRKSGQNIPEGDLKNITVTGCSALEYLSFDKNKVESIDLSNCPELKTIICPGNKLKSLDFTKCEKMQRIECQLNDIEEIKLASVNNLTRINCYSNLLTIQGWLNIANLLPEAEEGLEESSKPRICLVKEGETVEDEIADIIEQKNWRLVDQFEYTW